MSVDQIVVDLSGTLLILFVAWFFWFSKREGTLLQANSGGTQEALIVVKGGYTPDILVVRAGEPVRLNFNRQESAACSEMVIFPDFEISAELPEGETVPVQFVPEKPGEYEFHCQMGMLRGKLLVK